VRPPLGCGHVTTGDATLRGLQCYIGLRSGCPPIVCRTHGHVNIFKDQPRRDASGAVGGFDEIVARLAAMFAAECVDEEERLGKLPGFDQEAGAIDFPCCRSFSHVHLPFGGRENEKAFSHCDCRFRFLLSPAQPRCRRRCQLCWLKCG
jgi:hypothetical protein